MLFPTIRFALFFAVVLPVSWLLVPKPSRWKAFLVAVSWFFYATADVRFLPLLVGSTVVNQGFAEWVHRADAATARRHRTTIAVAMNLGALGWFKYAGFLGENASSILRFVGVDVTPPFAGVALPVGISFFTFQALSYVLDVHRRQLEPVAPIDFAVYLSFFPHLVAGPIVRASEFVPQIGRRLDPRRVEASRAFWLIAAGLAKKVVVAEYLATEIVDPLFAVPARHGGFEALVGIYAYAIQIYADFSGYTDIAIGLALLLGIRFPQNFDRPYSATSLQDFWRRWHMTLSRWLRDYLYIPLGGSHGGLERTYRNLVLTMVLGGLWHGAAWTFVLWGGLHGVGLVTERVLGVGERRGAGVWLGRLLTFHIVCLAWVLFRATSMANAADVLGRLVAQGRTPLDLWVVAIVAGMLAVQVLPRTIGAHARDLHARMGPVAQGAVLAMVLVAIDMLGPPGVAPFIYFRF